MFVGATAFNQALNFDLSSLESMHNMFHANAISDCNKKAIADAFLPQTKGMSMSYSYDNMKDNILTPWSTFCVGAVSSPPPPSPSPVASPPAVAAGPCGDGYAVVENGLKLKKKLKKLKKVKTIAACAAICKNMGTCGGFHFKAKAKVSCSLYKSGVSKNKCKKKRTCCEKSP
jgi:hypothetical protein